MVEQQNATRQHQRRSKQPVAIPQQALDENSQPVNEDRADSKIADKYAQCQDQAYHAAYLPADRPGLRLFSGSPAAGFAACFFCCFLL